MLVTSQLERSKDLDKYGEVRIISESSTSDILYKNDRWQLTSHVGYTKCCQAWLKLKQKISFSV